jgi:uncharacterized protein YukE
MTDRDDIIEELYSLEQSWRGGLPSRSVNWSAADQATNACADELADLIKELTEDAHLVQNDGRDAARYRWMRRGLANTKLLPEGVAEQFAKALDANDATQFDAAIDAAIHAQAGESK